MENNKTCAWKKVEKFGLAFVLIAIIMIGIIRKDDCTALISAICGVLYTFLAGKGLPVCYIFGVTGSGFYSFLALQNSLWANLLLYAGYYLPMQVLGYFRWNKNLQNGKKEIIKISLSKKELSLLILILLIISILVYLILVYYHDKNPFLDSITAVFSIGGMYLTVRRAVEQWIFWMVVNTLSILMWINVAISGARVYSTIAMWTVYLFLAIYFYNEWRKEILVTKN